MEEEILNFRYSISHNDSNIKSSQQQIEERESAKRVQKAYAVIGEESERKELLLNFVKLISMVCLFFEGVKP